MRDLLIRLDQRVDDGFKNINAKLDEMTRRADGHENRIRNLETWQSTVVGNAQGIGLGWKIGSALLGGVTGVLALLGFQSAVLHNEKPNVAKQEMNIERSVSMPRH
ncbi:hypothetical protein LL268_21460 [Sphingobium lactosutens]|nr:hypothetical protein [Sphingobium sp. UBA5915]MCC4259013.1 hypothetical protein [Sphingobium lactosutens]